MRTLFLHGPQRGRDASSYSVEGGGETFDYYIGPSGSDANPGTLASPWAITALWTKAATYAGHSLGLLDGTYSGYNGADYNGSDCAYVIPSGAAGSSGSPTVIGAVNARAVTLKGDGGHKAAPWTRAQCGMVIQGAYVTVQDLEIMEAAGNGIEITAANVTVKRCHVHRIDRVAYGDGGYDNQAAIRSDFAASPTISHNYCHDVVTGNSTGANESCIELYGSTNAIVEYNECTDANTGIFLKDSCGGAIVQYNYIYAVGRPLYYGTNNAFAFTMANNVVEGWTQDGYNRDNYNEIAGTVFRGNTFILNTSCASGVNITATSGSVVSFYNNLIARQGSGASTYGDMNSGGSNTFVLSDYNLYGSTVTFTNPSGTERTFSGYQTQLGGKEAHSVNSAPTFVGGGSSVGPYQWKLDTGSAGLNAGSSDGTTGGSTVNVGAFPSSGQTEQIGPTWRWPES